MPRRWNRYADELFDYLKEWVDDNDELMKIMEDFLKLPKYDQIQICMKLKFSPNVQEIRKDIQASLVYARLV
jgi:NAD(P)H-dependent FMN reductase